LKTTITTLSAELVVVAADEEYFDSFDHQIVLRWGDIEVQRWPVNSGFAAVVDQKGYTHMIDQFVADKLADLFKGTTP